MGIGEITEHTLILSMLSFYLLLQRLQKAMRPLGNTQNQASKYP